MRKFKINRDYNGIGCNIYQKGTVTINPGVTVLVGCNGIGKTTLIYQLKQQLEKENIPVLSFDNLRDGGHHARSTAMFYQDFAFVGASMQSSEGENITLNIGNFAGKVGAFQRRHSDAEELWVFLDAVDSGLSVDNVVELKDVLFRLILENRGNTEVYIIVSANEYELARGEACFDVLRCKYTKFSSYERYRNFILKTREVKDARVYKPTREQPLRRTPTH